MTQPRASLGLLAFALCAMLLLAVAIPTQASADEVIRLSYSNFFPPTHVQSQLAEEWAKEVETRTGGKVVIDYYPGGTLTSAKNNYDGVVQGLSDIGMSALAYSRGRFPVMAAVDLPMGYPDGVTATRAANELYEKFHPAELDDTEVMYLHAHGPGVLCTKGKPVRKLEDVAGLKLRATGNSAAVVQALGGTPVAQSMPDAYQSIQKGMVDGGLYPMETNKGWKMAEVVDTCTKARPLGYTTTFFVVMNKDKWNGLPADVQATIREINAEWAVKHGQAWDASDDEGAQYLLSKGGSIIELDPEQVTACDTAVAPVVQEYVSTTDPALEPQAVVDSLRDCMAQ